MYGITCIEDTEKLQQEQARDVYTSHIIEDSKGGSQPIRKKDAGTL